jgi:signal transduction histidine kinase
MELNDQSSLIRDLTNLLTVIVALAESLRQRLPPDQPADSDSVELIRLSQRALALARRGARGTSHPVAREGSSVDAFLDRMSPRLAHMVGSRLRLVIRVGGPAGTVRASWDQLERLLLNLMLNASAATRDGGAVTIETSASDYLVDGAPQKQAHRRYVRLSVHDSGAAIPAYLQQEIIESSAAASAEDGGLGLDRVARIVRQLDGRLQIESEEGVGTSVHVDLPLQ